MLERGAGAALPGPRERQDWIDQLVVIRTNCRAEFRHCGGSGALEQEAWLKQSMAEKVGGMAGYAGDLTPQETWKLLETDRNAVLVDVRSRPEWSFVGVPDLSSIGKRTILVAWQHWQVGPSGPTMAANADFARELAAAGVTADTPVVFLCRSGARSRSAAIAMTQSGHARAYNLSGGFEGPHDSSRHRGSVEGWKAAGLPWVQD